MEGLRIVVPSEQVVLDIYDLWLSHAQPALQAGLQQSPLPLSAQIWHIYIQFYILENTWPEATQDCGSQRPAPLALFQVSFEYFRAQQPAARNCLTLTQHIYPFLSAEQEQHHSLVYFIKTVRLNNNEEQNTTWLWKYVQVNIKILSWVR